MDNVLIKYYPNNVWICGDTYESLIWKDKTTEKTTCSCGRKSTKAA